MLTGVLPALKSNTSIMNSTIYVWVSEKQNCFQAFEGVKSFDKQPSRQVKAKNNLK